MFRKCLVLLSLASFSLHAEGVIQEESLKSCHPLFGSHRTRTFEDLIVRDSLTAGSLGVLGNAVIGGNLAVSGTVAATNFVTPTGPLFNGLRNYAVLSNQTPVPSGSNILWSPSAPAGNISAGISVDGAGNIILPTSGIFFVQYTVRFDKSPFNGTNTVVVQLQQTSGGVLSNVTQSTVTNNNSADGVTAAEPASQVQVSGYALITVTSSSNNTLALGVTITGSNISIPAASGIDANAQFTVLQLN